MSMTGLDTFDKTIHESNNWLKDLMFELGSEDRHRAYLTLRAVLQVLRDRLTPEETADLGAQLPLLIRGIYYEGWRPAGKPVKIRQKEEFLQQVVSHFAPGEELEPETATRAVFKLLRHRISEGEIKKIMDTLPGPIAELWPHPVGGR
jgi:uncharacterized protein (DUF2267 family)